MNEAQKEAESKTQWEFVDTSTKIINPRSKDGELVLAVFVNALALIILYFIS